jgi:hypothetical protein
VVHTATQKRPPPGFFKSRNSPLDPSQKSETSQRDVIGATARVAKITTGEIEEDNLYDWRFV